MDSKQQRSDASKWFTQVNLPPKTIEQNEVYQLILESEPAQMEKSLNDANPRAEQTEHSFDWYSSLFTTPGKEWQDFMEFVKEQIATTIFLGKRIVLFHGDTYIKQKLSLDQTAPVSVEDVFVRDRQNHRKLLIEADAGQGKTSLLRHSAFLISQAASDQSNSEKKKTIGFYLRADTLCNELNIGDKEESKDLNLETVIRVFLRQCRSSLASHCHEHLMEFVNSHVDSVVLLIDSLDELSQALRAPFLKKINSQGMILSGDKNKNVTVDQVVIASRPIPEDRAEFNSMVYTIESLSVSQQKMFVIKHFGATAESKFRIDSKSWEAMVASPNYQQSNENDNELEKLVQICKDTLKYRDRLKTQGNPLLLFLLCLHLEYIHDKRLEHQSKQNYTSPVKPIDEEIRLFRLYESIVEMTIERSQERLHSDPRFRSLFLPWQAEKSRAWLLDLMTVTAFACHWIGSQNEETDDLCPRKDRVSAVLSAIQKSENRDWKLYSVLSAQEELLVGQDLVDVLVSLPGLCQLTREDNPSVYFVNRTIQEFLTARCCLAMFDGLKFGRSDSWSLLYDKIPEINSIPRSDFWKNERIICSKWWSRVILFAASYDHDNESGLGWLWRSIDGPKEPGIDKKDLGMVRLWHLLQSLPSVSAAEQEIQKLDEIYLWVMKLSAIGAFRLVEENPNVGDLFGKGGLVESKKEWEKMTDSKDSISQQLANELKKRQSLPDKVVNPPVNPSTIEQPVPVVVPTPGVTVT